MTKILKQFRQDFTLIVAGFQETIISIADHVSQSVQKVKVDLATADLEKEIKESQVSIGKLIYKNPEMSSEELRDGLAHAPEMKALIAKAETGQKSLDAIMGTVSPREALNNFERLLIRSDFVVQHVLIVEGFSGIGKSIKELGLPGNMLIFFIKKNKHIEIADGGVVIEIRDEVTFLCSKENSHHYIGLWS